MSSEGDFFKFKCAHCGIVLTCDLSPLEMRVCPICGCIGTIKSVETAQPVFCSNCGDAMFPCDARGCLACGRELCQHCWGSSDFCIYCADPKTINEEMPVWTIQ